MKLKAKHNKGFTLVELLVVIAIIAVLATLAAPAILGALKKSKITKSRGVCNALEIAVDNFESEYNFLPYSHLLASSPTSDSAGRVNSEDDIITVLAGQEDSVNFKEIRFFELGAPKGTSAANYKDGMHIEKVGAPSADLYDPWGKKVSKTLSGLYQLVLDYDQDGVIEHPYDASKDINGKKVVVYSCGPDGDVSTAGVRDKLNKDNPSNF